jgi:hypothetical protein
MAVTRTILPKTGLVQPQHASTAQWEADDDANWLLLDGLVPLSGQMIKDLGLNGVCSGFALSTSSSLTPGLTAGVLYAQGSRYAPAAAPNPGPAPASATNYLFYNSDSGFYYQASAVGATAGDALIGQVTTSGTAVTAVVDASKVYGQISFAPSDFGNFTVQHYLGRTPKGVALQMTSDGAIWFQSPTMYDATNLYLVASAGAITGKAVVW